MSHDDLEQRLGSALRTGLAGEVDLGPVVRGARVRAERARRRRVAAVGLAAALAVAVPAGAVGWTALADDRDRPAAVDVATQPARPEPTQPPPPEPTQPESTQAEPTPPDPTQPESTQPEAAQPAAEPQPTGLPAPEVDPSTLDPGQNGYDVPESALLQPADLPVAVVELSRSTYRNIPVVPGQACGGAPGLEPLTALTQQVAEENSNDFDQLAVSVQVTGWSRGDGAAAFAEVGDDTGRCRWLDEVAPDVGADAAGRPRLTLTRSNGGLRFWAAVVRVEDLLVAVEVSGPVDGGTDRAELTAGLAQTVADRLVAAGAVGSAP